MKVVVATPPGVGSTAGALFGRHGAGVVHSQHDSTPHIKHEMLGFGPPKVWLHVRPRAEWAACPRLYNHHMPDLTEALRQFDETETNLKRLEEMWQ
jgi:hypothetical protein